MWDTKVAPQKLKKQFPDAVVDTLSFRGEQTVVVKRDAILPVCQFLAADPTLSFDFLTDICGVDYPDREKRFEVVYHLYSMKRKTRLRLKTAVGEGEALSTVESVWKAASWFERESYDMFGLTSTPWVMVTRVSR